MRILVELYAAAREQAGAGELALEVGSSNAPPTLADVRSALCERFPQLERSIAVSRLAVNSTFAADSTQLAGDDRVALILPVSGG